MHRTNLLILAFSLGTQARVLERQVSSNTTTTTTSTSTVSPSPVPTVIAGSCAQDTLQYCCPLVVPTEGESSVDFASACMNGNLPASLDCFFAFQDTCCSGISDENGNSCEIVPPDTDICAPGAAGSISSLGAIAGAITVTEIVDCTAAPTSTSTSSVATTTTLPPSSTSTPSSPISTPIAPSSSSTTSDSASTTAPPPSLHRRDSGGWIGALV
ncbi:hypothetical protein BDZ45DRAFT_697869 [Acephala macrosclerotiorum]|nr:hypothetical protein BDZ45DRAFT_697869 [Acephala macrosclerotiorum]